MICNHLESNKLDAHDKEVYEGLLKSPEEQNVKSDSKYLLHKLADAVAIRGPQADSVAQAISRQSGKYLLVCGDFNDTPISYTYQRLSRVLTSAFRQSGTGMGFSFNQDEFFVRIDHVFFSRHFESTKTLIDRHIYLSDHYPIVTYLRLRSQ